MPENNQGNVEKKSGEVIDALPDIKRYYKALGIEIAWHRHENGLTSLQSRIHSPETDPSTPEHLGCGKSCITK